MSLKVKILFLAIAGGLGALARYSLAGVVQRATGVGFPWGTLVVNMTGCFLFGVIWALFEGRIISSEARIIILAGFLGAFTTFSSFIFETGELFKNNQFIFAFLNIFAQNVFGLVVFFGGLFMGRAISFS